MTLVTELKSYLINQFQAIGHRLDLSDKPISFGGDPVFQMTIRRTPRGIVREEWFEMYIPEQAEVSVVVVDEKRQQVVLSVKEDANEFVQKNVMAFDPVNNKWGRSAFMNEEDREQFFQEFITRMSRFTNEIKRSDIVHQDGEWVIIRRTPARKRHFLMGKDERQLFICQLPKLVKTMPEAYDSLKQPTILLAEGKNKNVIRQGEWFFVNATGVEMEKIKRLLKDKKVDIKRGQNIGAIAQDRLFIAGNPHVADEIIVIPSKFLMRGWSVMETQLFVKGCVRHHDHKTIVCGNWRRCLRNTEVQDTSEAITGWID